MYFTQDDIKRIKEASKGRLLDVSVTSTNYANGGPNINANALNAMDKRSYISLRPNRFSNASVARI